MINGIMQKDIVKSEYEFLDKFNFDFSENDNNDIVLGYDLRAQINECWKNETKLIVVEDDEDEKIYKDFVLDKDDKIDVISIRSFNLGSGCNSIIKLLKDEKKYLDEIEGKKYIRGIIDSDAWKFRKNKEKRDEKLESIKDYIIALDRYNIESYFFGQDCLKEIISDYTNASKDEINNIVLKPVWETLWEKVLDSAYYIGVLSLCKDYYTIESQFSFNCDFGNIKTKEKRKHTLTEEIKKYEKYIEKLEKEKNIKKEKEFILSVVNGKVLNYIIASEILDIFKEISKNKCLKKVFTKVKCNVHPIGGTCKFKPKIGLGAECNISVDIMYTNIRNKFDSNSSTELRNKFISLFYN